MSPMSPAELALELAREHNERDCCWLHAQITVIEIGVYQGTSRLHGVN